MGMPPKIRLTGHMDVPANRLASIQAALVEHTALTRAEPGCISFSVEPCEQVAGRFLVSELFRDQAAFEAHQVRVKASDWGRISAGIPRAYRIEQAD